MHKRKKVRRNQNQKTNSRQSLGTYLIGTAIQQV